MLIDLWIACFGIILLDVIRRNRKGLHNPLSPVAVFVASIVLLYLVPITATVNGYSSPGFFPSRLDDFRIDLVLSALRLFLWMIMSLFVLRHLGSRSTKRIDSRIRLITRRQLRVVATLALITWLLHLASGVGFSPRGLVERALRPREFTNLRVGNALFIYPRQAVLPLYLAIAALAGAQFWRSSRRIPAHLFGHFTVAVGLNVLGGNKTAVVIAFLYLVASFLIVNRRIAQRKVSLKTLRLLAVGAIFTPFVLLAAFSLMRTSGLKAAEVTPVDHLLTYSRESYHTANVIADYEAQPSLLVTSLADSVRGAVPRQLFPDKGPVGLYSRIWKPRYEPNSLAFHASTYGFLAEAHMFFGAAGPAIYAAVFFSLLWAVESKVESRIKDGGDWAFYLLCLHWVFLFSRAGFTGSALLNFVAVALILRVCWKFVLSVTRTDIASPKVETFSRSDLARV